MEEGHPAVWLQAACHHRGDRQHPVLEKGDGALVNVQVRGREMSFFGYEKDRNTLMYRCPVRVNEFDCQGFEACLAHPASEAVHYGQVVRINLNQHNSRIFTPTPRHTRRWEKA